MNVMVVTETRGFSLRLVRGLGVGAKILQVPSRRKNITDASLMVYRCLVTTHLHGKATVL